MNLRSSPFLLFASLCLACGGEEPIVIGPTAQPADGGPIDAMSSGAGGSAGQPGGAGGSAGGPGGAGGQGGGAGGQGGGGPIEPAPDLDLFLNSVTGLLYASCSGPACHDAATPNPSDALYQLVEGGPQGLSSDQQRLNFDETISFVDFDDPPESQLLVHHPPAHQAYVIPGSQTHNRIIEWIADAVEPPAPPEGMGGAGGDGGAGGQGGEGGVGEGGPIEVPCDGIPPPGNPAGRSQGYRDAYEMPDADGLTINDMLVASCGEMGACHGTQAAAGGYWLLNDLDDPCAVQWNYLVSQWFIDAVEPNASLLLTKPRERDHGGRVVFRGTDDARHVRLLLWIENEFAAR